MIPVFAAFICGTLASAVDVGYDGYDLTPGISPLPGDCYWTIRLDKPQKVIREKENMEQITVNGILIDIAYVVLGNGYRGYSAGPSAETG